MPLFYPVQAPEVLRMDSGKTEDVPDHFYTKNGHKKSYHILFHVHIIHINQILEKKMNTIPANIYELIQHYNNIDLCNTYIYIIYTINDTIEEREEVLESIGFRWNSQKCTTVYYNIQKLIQSMIPK